jgi:hypothetical protein
VFGDTSVRGAAFDLDLDGAIVPFPHSAVT